MAVFVLQECASTNLAVREEREKYGHLDTVVAISQTAGRGQHTNRWESAPGENLTCSIVLEPSFLKATRQFLLSEVVALALADTLKSYGIAARIKWTNDIYVGERKICGVLIEHDLQGNGIIRTVAGIGLNINQTIFPEWVPNPTSMKLETGEVFDVGQVLNRLLEALAERFEVLAGGDAVRVEQDYRSMLYRIGELHPFRLPGMAKPIAGVIRGVESSGELIVEIGGTLRSFCFGEIEFVIAERGR